MGAGGSQSCQDVAEPGTALGWRRMGPLGAVGAHPGVPWGVWGLCLWLCKYPGGCVPSPLRLQVTVSLDISVCCHWYIKVWTAGGS